MATRKIFFVLSLALLINPALHCMDSTEEEGTATTKYVMVGLGLVGAAALCTKTLKNIINRKKQELLYESQNIEVFTSEKSTESHSILKGSGSELSIYGIFKNSSDETLKKFRGKLVKELFPSNLALLFDRKYNLDSRKVLSCMTSMHLDGIVAISSPDDQGERKTFVVCSGSYFAYNIVDRSIEIIKYSVRDIHKGHVALFTKHVGRVCCNLAVQNNKLLSDVINEKMLWLKHNNKHSNHDITQAVQTGFKQYQDDIVKDIFQENNKSILGDRAVLMIPVQQFYNINEPKLNMHVPLFEKSDSNS